MGPDTFTMVLDVPTIAAGTAEQREFSIPSGSWRLTAATYMPSTEDVAHATNYTTLSLKQGMAGNVIGTVTNATTAFTKGTARDFTLTSAYCDFTGGTTVLEITKAENGSGGILDGAFYLTFERLHA